MSEFTFKDALLNPGKSPIVDKAMNDLLEVYSAFVRKRFDTQSRGGGEWPPIKNETIIGRQAASVRRVRDMIDDGHYVGAQADKALKRARAKVEKLKDTLDPQRIMKRLNAKHKAEMDELIKKNPRNLEDRRRKLGARHQQQLQKTYDKVDAAKARQKKFKVAILVDTGLLRGALTIGSTGNVAKRISGGVRFGIAGGTHDDGKTTIGEIAAAHDSGGTRLPRRRIIVKPDGATMRVMKRILARAYKESRK